MRSKSVLSKVLVFTSLCAVAVFALVNRTSAHSEKDTPVQKGERGDVHRWSIFSRVEAS